MKMNRTLTVMVCAALGLSLAAGCTHYGGTTASRAGRTPGQYVDDKAISAQVHKRLQEDPSVSALPIEVLTFQNEVQLTGFVEFPQQAQRAEEIARSVSDVASVRNNIVVKRQMGLNERIAQPQPTPSGHPPAERAGTELQRQSFSGEVISLTGTGPDNLRVRTEQGELPVRAAQWDQRKSELGLRQGDNVQIRGYLSGFGQQRHIVAEQITAHGKTVRFESTGQPYRETGAEQNPTR